MFPGGRGPRDRGVGYTTIIREGIEIDVEREVNRTVCGCSGAGGGWRSDGGVSV